MYKILISGYYGFDNIGDESILNAVIKSIRARLPDCALTVLSHDPAGTRKKYGVEAVDRMAPLESLRAVRRCDMLISGGGSLLQDVTSSKSLRYYLAIIRLAVYEMLEDEEVPVSVAINEAVRLAKKYSSETAPSFVNGVLAALVPEQTEE